MSGGYNIDPDYVDVAERIRLFYELYPDGRLTTEPPYTLLFEGRTFVCCTAHAYRVPDDPTPSTGVAWEPVPGPTPFTKDSELMNAQTSAWGRAIIAAGIPSKKIASADEVAARRAPADESGVRNPAKVTRPQHARIGGLVKSLTELDPHTDWVDYSRGWVSENYGKTSRADLLASEASVLIEHLTQLEAERKAA